LSPEVQRTVELYELVHCQHQPCPGRVYQKLQNCQKLKWENTSNELKN